VLTIQDNDGTNDIGTLTLNLSYNRVINTLRLVENQAKLLCGVFPANIEGLEALEGSLLTLNVDIDLHKNFYKMAIDTASPISWVSTAGSNITFADPPSDRSNSECAWSLSCVQTLLGSVQVVTNHGKLIGNVKSGLFSIAPSNAYKINFIVADYPPREFTEVDMSGVLGLGDTRLAIGSYAFSGTQFPFKETIIDAMFRESDISTKMFSIDIDFKNQTGTITFGGWNPMHRLLEDNFTWLPIPGVFSVSFHSVRYQSMKLSLNLLLDIDTLSSHRFNVDKRMHRFLLISISSALGSSCGITTMGYIYCRLEYLSQISRMPTIEISAGGKWFSINTLYFISSCYRESKLQSSGFLCFTSIKQSPYPYLIGLPLLYTNMLVFDKIKNRIGIRSKTIVPGNEITWRDIIDTEVIDKVDEATEKYWDKMCPLQGSSINLENGIFTVLDVLGNNQFLTINDILST
jgi:Eukaryotic aspartyl protease